MPKFFSLEKPKKEKVEEINQELKEFPELKPRLTFDFPLNENRRGALEMINQEQEIDFKKVTNLLNSEDFIERGAGLYLAGSASSKEVQEKAAHVLEDMSRSEDPILKIVAARGAVSFGDKFLPILDELSHDESNGVREIAIQGLGRIGTKNAIRVLEKLSEDKSFSTRCFVIYGAILIGEKALHILKKLSQDKDRYVRRTVAENVAKIGDKAFSILKELSQDKEPDIQKSAILELAKFGEKSRPILENIKDRETFLDWSVERALGQIKENNKKDVVPKAYSWLLSARKSMFATPDTKDLAAKISKVAEISKELKKKYGDKFIGITILGSAAKGYFEKRESDLDWGIIAKDEKISKEFQELGESLGLCCDHYADIDKNNRVKTYPEVLFYGLFFGDRKELLKLQKIAVENMSESAWEEIRKITYENELKLSKAKERQNIKEKDLEKTEQFAALLRVPLSYNETLKIFESK